MRKWLVNKAGRNYSKIYIGWKLQNYGYDLNFIHHKPLKKSDDEELEEYREFANSYLKVGIYHYERLWFLNKRETKKHLWKMRIKKDFAWLLEDELEGFFMYTEKLFGKYKSNNEKSPVRHKITVRTGHLKPAGGYDHNKQIEPKVK